MQYRKIVKNAEDISLLGYGCMRFPMKGNSVDEDLTEKQILHAIEKGINYFDTAYIYHGGKSEVILGNIIKKHDLRKKIYIADKLPAYFINTKSKIETIFNTQLQRLSTDYIDYYLMHALDSFNAWQTLKNFGIIDWIASKKASGQIRHIGFSFHGKPEDFIKILEDYPWDFCQIQYNYLDENHQAGKSGLLRAYELSIGVIIMEPLRGGNLASKAPTKVIETFANFSDKHSPAYFSLRWIFNHKEVAMVLSGMNEFSHIDENAEVASITTPSSMSADELSLIDEVKAIYLDLMKVPCTGCNYCMPCPFNVAIPMIFNDYNSKYFFGKALSRAQYMSRVTGAMAGGKSGANLCTSCGKCKKHCPQNIDIPTELKKAHKELDNVPMRIAFTIYAKYVNFKRRNLKERTPHE